MIFPDNSSMANFIIREKIRGAEVNTFEKVLVALMNDKQIVNAKALYGAILKAIIPNN